MEKPTDPRQKPVNKRRKVEKPAVPRRNPRKWRRATKLHTTLREFPQSSSNFMPFGRKTIAIPAGGLASGVLAEELPGVEEVVPDSVEAAGHGGDWGEIVDAEPDDEASVFLAEGLAGGN